MAGTLVGMLLAGCSSSSAASGKVSVVGSFYPLAWAAEQVGGDRVDVTDLTPPGVEAHDTSLSAQQILTIDEADLVLILGDIGFQPQVEDAARQASGTVVQVTGDITLRPSEEAGLSVDPHIWLDPALMVRIVDVVARALAASDPGGAAGFGTTGDTTAAHVSDLDHAYRSGLSGCRFTTFVTTHEAFGYMADEYGLHQLAIEGLTPEAEPSAAQLHDAEDAIRSGAAAPAVFYESTDEGERIGRSVASDVGVDALPLGTLEFDPSPGDYLSVMQANLQSLRQGLQCP